MAKARDIGYDVKIPDKECDDADCPFHGKISIRGKILGGRVVSDKMQNTVVVQIDYLHKIPKYERFERRKSRLSVHNPPCINAKKGEAVRIGECRPLSKTKHFIVLERM